MLNFDLSQKLKDKGFPQGFNSEQVDLYGEYWCSLDGSDPIVIFLSNQEYINGSLTTVKGTWTPVAKCPKLDELIAACGDEFYSVVKLEDGTFNAFSTTDGQNTIAKVIGSTPEEAVATLYMTIK